MTTPGKTPLQTHVGKWEHGCGNHVCTRARHVVLGRGDVPCDVLCVGEAPGESEDVIGQPFVGPAGKLLDRIIARALGGFRYCTTCRRGNVFAHFPCPENPCLCANGHGEEDAAPLRVAFTNLVGCIPREGNRKAAEPEPDEIKRCAPRLEEFVALARPRLVVLVGKLAATWLEQGYKHSVKLPKGVKTVTVDHPAFILRSNYAQQGLLIQRCEVAISTAAEDL